MDGRIAGIGTDIVSVPRMTRLVSTRGPRFTERWFTMQEIAYCTRLRVPSRHFAARFAAKEAVVKALPGGWDGPLPYRNVEIVHDSQGAPAVRLGGRVQAAADAAGISTIFVSLSHCDDYAVAMAWACFR
jgi:holo-[acyl-carrier protein] synthase